MSQTEVASFYAQNRGAWRNWLQENHEREQSVWLICYKVGSGMPRVSWEEAVEEALCFGWIDSKRQPIDSEKFRQFFCKRKPKGNWSRINKEKVEQLILSGRMTQAGLDSIEVAKKNGSWFFLDSVEDLTIPEDLDVAFNEYTGSRDVFLSLSKSSKKILLHWILSAKRAETRSKRIIEIVSNGQNGSMPKPFRYLKTKT